MSEVVDAEVVDIATEPGVYERFISKIAFPTEDFWASCWVWAAGTAEGYGRFARFDRGRRAHRIAYNLWRGPIPADTTVDHLCYNRACVNPLHLDICSRGENSRRAWATGHCKSPKLLNTHCPQGHPFDEANTLLTSAGHRRCRTCHRDHQRRYRQRISA